MTHFIRDENGLSIVDCEVNKDDVRCLVDVEYFANFLLRKHYTHWSAIIDDFKALQEIRGTWFEGQNRNWPDLRSFVETAFRNIAAKWGLQYITD
jgi:hypothetical protein